MIRIRNKLINTSIDRILHTIRKETNGEYIKDIKPEKNGSIQFTCPYHANHNEKHPSCGIISDPNSSKEGIWHCFTCGAKGYITDLIGYCFNNDKYFGEDWLLERFGNIIIEEEELLLPIELETKKKEYLDPNILKQYSYFHPYMFKRGLNESTIKKFHIGYDKDTDSITFPMWDIKSNLVGITERSVNTKRFYIPEDLDKPVYLLNYIVKENIQTVWVCESQLNTLLCWQRGRPAIGLIGTGTRKQYEILKKSGIREYFLAFDGDEAGDKGKKRFIENMPKDILINIVNIPRGKDVADLSDEEFEKLTYYKL